MTEYTDTSAEAVLELRDSEPPTQPVGVAAPRPSPVDVSVLAPTRNENDNVRPLAGAITAAMMGSGRSWELLFVDDSDDATPHTIAELSARSPYVRLLHRPRGHRGGGLSGAVVAGFAAARGRAIVVMDGDLQHPPAVARELATLVLTGTADVAVASRYVAGGSAVTGLDGPRRRLVSRACTAAVHALLPGTRGVRDPMSGFFAVSRSSVAGARLHPRGFKILMEVLARLRGARVVELPFQLAPRAAGSSKAGAREGLSFLRHLGRLVWPSWAAMGAAFRRVALQAPLAGILALQSWLSLQLIFRNTAFVDEATYLSAGQWLLHTWFGGGGADMHFAAYFSGSPYIYPVLVALVNDVGGLAAARFMSLGFMLIATLCCHATARRLWGRLAGLMAAAAFATLAGAQFLGAFATYDAMALMLISVAAWIAVRFADSTTRRAAIGLVIPVLILANATKYASLIFDLPVLALAFLVILDRHGARVAVRTTAILLAGLGVSSALLLGIAGRDTLTGLMSTTLSRAHGATPARVVLEDAWGWVGAMGCLAALAALVAGVMAWRRRVSWPTVAILAVLAVAVALAPAEQARIDTLTSLSKHVIFGAWFGALGAGWLLAQVVGRRPRHAWRLAFAAAALVPMGVVGAAQARHLFDEWPSSGRVVDALRPLVAHDTLPVLMDNAEVARYYLEDELSVPHWNDTFYFAYTPPGSSTRLVGSSAYAAAVDHGYFGVIALDYSEQIHYDRAIAAAIHASHRYAWVGDFSGHSVYGRDTYVVWRLAPSLA